MTTGPTDLDVVLQEGIGALRWAEGVLEFRIAQSHEPEPLLLELRDVRGLADRLESGSPQEWRDGWMRSLLSGQDLGVLLDWEQRSIGHRISPRDATDRYPLSRRAQFRKLRQYLQRYMESA
jgi:hypothetical protein